MMIMAGLLAASAYPLHAEAQKKAKAKVPAVQQTPPTEEAVVAPATPAPEPQVTPSASSGAIVEILKKHLGQKTNLGVLNKIGKDFIELKEENVLLTVPLQSVHSLKQVNDKDDNDKDIVRLEIKLIAKD